MTTRAPLLASALALLLLAGCGSDQTINPGGLPNPGTDSDSGANGVTVVVSYQGQSIPVDLGSIGTSPYKGVNLVRLSDVWTGSQIAEDRSALVFEFVGADGFKPSNKGCEDLEGSVLDRGYIDPTSRKLTWDESLGFKGCYSVNDVANVNAHTPAGGGSIDAAAE